MSEIVKLNPDQLKAVEAVKTGKNVFITGGAGSGKSTLLKYLIQEVFPKDGSTFVTAPTGIAAVNVGGTTIHSFAGIGLGKGPWDKILRRLSAVAQTNWAMCQRLVIDEISMISAQMLELLDYIARRRKNPDQAFGGIQVVLIGDFYQLPPVFKFVEGDEKDCRLAFESPVWVELNLQTQILEKQERQSEPEFIEFLDLIRRSKTDDPRVEQTFQQLSQPLELKTTEPGGPPVIKPTRLYTKNIDVQAENIEELMRLKGPQNKYICIDKTKPAFKGGNLSDFCRALPVLYLRKGAQVILLMNDKEDKSLVNGSRGVVVDFTTEGSLPVVQFHNGVIKAIDWHVWEIKNNKGDTVATRQQIPLNLAWSMTIHKSQGQTIDFLEVDISDVFLPGMAYVCLSRATSTRGLHVMGYSIRKITTDPRVVEFYSQEAKN
jgi:ATP-dependent DNA helicase PIF1